MLSYFYYGAMSLEAMIVIFLVWGKSVAGYLLIVYYGLEGGLDWLISRVGRGRSKENIYFQWELARYVALMGIALLFTFSHRPLRKPF